MAVAATPTGYLERPRPSGLADVVEVILDKGLVIDAFVRVSLIGIEILTIDARIVVASVDTYLRFAEAVNRLDLGSTEDAEGLPDIMGSITEGGAKHKTQGALEAAKDKVLGDGDDDDGKGNGRRKTSQAKRSSSSRSRSRSRQKSS